MVPRAVDMRDDPQAPPLAWKDIGRRGLKRVIRRVGEAARLCHGRFGATFGRGELEAIRKPADLDGGTDCAACPVKRG